jgi:polar amino acid transport system substrate-binding protein
MASQARLNKTPYLHLLLTLFLFLVFTTTSCYESDGPSSASDSSLDRVRQTGELHVGYFLFEPTIVEGEDGKLQGVFIELVESIADALDAEVVYHKVDLANFVAGLHSRQYDVSIGATFATPQRAAAVAFTRPIFYAGYTGVVQRGQAAQYQRWQDIDRAGLHVAVKQGSAIDDFVREHFQNAEIVRLTGSDLTLPLAAVSSGQADVGLMNQITVFTYLREHPELEEVLSRNPVAPTNFSWAVRQDDQRWLNYLDTCIEYYTNTGDLYRWESQNGIPLMHMEERLVFPEMSYPQYWQLQDQQ